MQTKVLQTDAMSAEPRPPACAIETRALTKRFGEVQALHGLDLCVPTNSIFGFLGPNGAGKTTLIKLLLGLTRPTGGEVRVFGTDAVRDGLASRRRIGYLAQEARYYNHLTARETLEFTGRFFYRRSAALHRRVADSLELVGLADRADRQIKGFSGGERQRLGLAQAQINRPDLLILDEPAASLDPVGRHDVLEVMLRLREHATIFYSTHILDDVQRVSDHVAILDHGHLITRAATADLLADHRGRYQVSIDGDGAAAAEALRAQAWVTSVESTTSGGVTTLEIAVGDNAAASTELLTVLVASGVEITAFGRATHNLEDVFLRLVQGESR